LPVFYSRFGRGGSKVEQEIAEDQEVDG